MKPDPRFPNWAERQMLRISNTRAQALMKGSAVVYTVVVVSYVLLWFLGGWAAWARVRFAPPFVYWLSVAWMPLMMWQIFLFSVLIAHLRQHMWRLSEEWRRAIDDLDSGACDPGPVRPDDRV